MLPGFRFGMGFQQCLMDDCNIPVKLCTHQVSQEVVQPDDSWTAGAHLEQCSCKEIFDHR